MRKRVLLLGSILLILLAACADNQPSLSSSAEVHGLPASRPASVAGTPAPTPSYPRADFPLEGEAWVEFLHEDVRTVPDAYLYDPQGEVQHFGGSLFYIVRQNGVNWIEEMDLETKETRVAYMADQLYLVYFTVIGPDEFVISMSPAPGPPYHSGIDTIYYNRATGETYERETVGAELGRTEPPRYHFSQKTCVLSYRPVGTDEEIPLLHFNVPLNTERSDHQRIYATNNKIYMTYNFLPYRGFYIVDMENQTGDYWVLDKDVERMNLESVFGPLSQENASWAVYFYENGLMIAYTHFDPESQRAIESYAVYKSFEQNEPDKFFELSRIRYNGGIDDLAFGAGLLVDETFYYFVFDTENTTLGAAQAVYAEDAAWAA